MQPDEQQTISVMTIVLSSYALNGTWLGYTNWTKSFQLCGSQKFEADNWIKCVGVHGMRVVRFVHKGCRCVRVGGLRLLRQRGWLLARGGFVTLLVLWRT